MLNNKASFPDFAALSKYRQALSNNTTLLSLAQLGAGSKKPAGQKSVAALVKTAAQSPKYAELLYRLLKYFDYKVVVELGSSLGLSTLYLAKANPQGKVYTIEGDKAVFETASSLSFSQASNIIAINALFDEALPKLLNDLGTVDMVYIDGNHSYEATLRYFELLLPYLNENSLLVFDDIYWSEGMTRAWREIVAHQAAQYTIDLFQLGLVFFKPVKVKQHFVLKY